MKGRETAAEARERAARARAENARIYWSAFGVRAPIAEYAFAAPARQWRFDYAWPDLKVACEIEGGVWMGGRGAHSRPLNIERDHEKYNAAALRGWRIFHFQPRELRKGVAQAFMLDIVGGHRVAVADLHPGA